MHRIHSGQGGSVGIQNRLGSGKSRNQMVPLGIRPGVWFLIPGITPATLEIKAIGASFVELPSGSIIRCTEHYITEPKAVEEV